MNFVKIKTTDILNKTLFLSIILSPFDGLPITRNLGILQCAYFYFVTIGIIILGISFYFQNRKIQVNFNIVTNLLIFFLFYALISGVINIHIILNSEYKGRYGDIRFLSTYLIFIYIVIMLVYFNHAMYKITDIFIWMNKAILYSFYIAGGYAFFQVLSMFNFDVGNIVINYIGPWISFSVSEEIPLIKTWRIQSVCQEPSMFGVYMAAVFPWIIGNGFVINGGMFKKIMSFYALFVIVLSFSRTAYFITLLQVLMFICFFYKRILKEIFSLKKIMVLFIGIVIAFCGLYSAQFLDLIQIFNVFFSFTNDSVSTTSNLTRFGLQMAGISMFQAHPFFGVGLGQFQFHVIEYLPEWSYQSIEILGVANSGNPNFFYGSFNTYIRVLSEMGIIGFMIWTSIAGITLLKLSKYIKISRGIEKDFLKITAISFIGIFLSFANFDTYLLFHYWLIVALVYTLSNKYMRDYNKIEKGRKEC